MDQVRIFVFGVCKFVAVRRGRRAWVATNQQTFGIDSCISTAISLIIKKYTEMKTAAALHLLNLISSHVHNFSSAISRHNLLKLGFQRGDALRCLNLMQF
jgi:hypothetical protein